MSVQLETMQPTRTLLRRLKINLLMLENLEDCYAHLLSVQHINMIEEHLRKAVTQVQLAKESFRVPDDSDTLQ